MRYYADVGQTYLDPFAGHGIRAQVAALRGLNYYGSDICGEYVAYAQAALARTKTDGRHVEIRRADSRRPAWVPDGCGDFCFTSPPYWDCEYYDDSPEQLGTGHTYQEFLDGMGEVWQAWHPKFKAGAWIVVNVGDIRRDGQFIPYHADMLALMAHAGYRVHDIWVVAGFVAQLNRAFAVSFNRKKIPPRVHEYALVFRT